MWTTFFSVSVAFLAAFLIPLTVSATVRRNDRRRAERDPISRPDPTHMEVRFRTWQWVVWRVLGIAFVLVGALLSLVSIAGAGELDSPAPTIAAIAFLLAGWGRCCWPPRCAGAGSSRRPMRSPSGAASARSAPSR